MFGHFTTLCMKELKENILICLNFKPFQPSVAFHIETSHLFCRTKQMTGFYVKRSNGLKWVNPSRVQLSDYILNLQEGFEQQ